MSQIKFRANSNAPSRPGPNRGELTNFIPALRAFARSLCRNIGDADDLVHETLAKAITTLDEFDEGSRLDSWLLKIMRRAVYTKAEATTGEALDPPGCLSKQLSAVKTYETAPGSREVTRAVDLLPQEQRQVIVLIYMIGMSCEEAAEICECEISVIKTRAHRGVAELTALLGDGGEAGSADRSHLLDMPQ